MSITQGEPVRTVGLEPAQSAAADVSALTAVRSAAQNRPEIVLEPTRTVPPAVATPRLVLAPLLAEAAVTVFASYARTMQGAVEIGLRLQPELALTMFSPFATSDHYGQVERVRALLRGFSDSTLLEARRLELELSHLRERIAQTAIPSGAAYRRAWTVKP